MWARNWTVLRAGLSSRMMEDSVLTIDGVSQVAKRKPGRPQKVTLDVIEQVARLIAKGMTEAQACVRVGVNHDSFCTARMRRPEFEEAIKRAQAEYLDESLDIIGRGERGWQGRAWILERRHKPQFNRTPDSAVVDETGMEHLTDDELRAGAPSVPSKVREGSAAASAASFCS